MNVRSSKAKGRRLQNWVRDKLLTLFVDYPAFSITQEDIKSQTMGMVGEDIIITPHARKYLPFTFECKNTERLEMWKAIEQAEKNNSFDSYNSIIVFKKNQKKPHVAMSWETFELLLRYKADIDDHLCYPPKTIAAGIYEKSVKRSE